MKTSKQSHHLRVQEKENLSLLDAFCSHGWRRRRRWRRWWWRRRRRWWGWRRRWRRRRWCSSIQKIVFLFWPKTLPSFRENNSSLWVSSRLRSRIAPTEVAWKPWKRSSSLIWVPWKLENNGHVSLGACSHASDVMRVFPLPGGRPPKLFSVSPRVQPAFDSFH